MCGKGLKATSGVRLISCGLVFLGLAGCAGGGSARVTTPQLAAPALAQRSARESSADTLPHRNVLYVSGLVDNRVDIYPLNTNNPAPIGTIKLEIDTPTGMALDSARNLYVANNTTRTITDVRKGSPDLVTLYAPGNDVPDRGYS